MFVLGLAIPLSGQEAGSPEEPIQAHPEGDEAIAQLKSPFCPGLMLEVCSHPDSKALRDTLQAMAHDGMESDTLVAWMLGVFGEEYRAVPEARGRGLLAWVIPPVVIALGFLTIVVLLRRYRRRRPDSVTPAKPLSEEDESVLEAALQELKSAEEVPF